MQTTEKTLHDLTNQLAVVSGFAEILLADAAPDDRRREDFEEIQKAAANALGLVAQLQGQPAPPVP